MKNIWPAPLVLLAPLLLAGCNGKSFKEFTSKEGRFTVLMPTRPSERTQEGPFGKMKLFGYQEPDGAYAVATLSLPTDPKQAEATLDEAVKGLAANVHGKVTNQTKIQLNGRGVGRDVQMEIPGKDEQILHGRVFLINGRLYEVTSVGTKVWVESDDTTKFLDSFAALEEEKKPATP